MVIESRELSEDRELTEDEKESIAKSEKRVEEAMEKKTWIVVDSSFSEEWDILLLKSMNGLLDIAKLTRGGMSKDKGVDNSGEKVDSSLMFMAGVDNIAHRLSVISEHLKKNKDAESLAMIDESFIEVVDKISGNLAKCMIMGRKVSEVAQESADSIGLLLTSRGYGFDIFDLDEDGIYKEFRFVKCPEGYEVARG